ncbi:hypothetical protein NLI96_g5033 [Meripilus lineatus]|uniref:Uncharacterized protein n=1 Tax=Meripilus lineatus TaxID=2056292 RepID=A0AAD5YE93_9APHY|nr:hypothetical protein NLI96_g5033 [Physisporinus lineatus]
MVDWNSDERIAQDQVSYVKMMHCFAGFYFWEFLISLDFEWSLLRREKKFHWPMIPYFIGRYSALLLVISFLISVDTTNEVDCQSLFITFAVCSHILMVASGDLASIQISVLFTFGFASINLALRVMVVWSMSWYCVVPLCILIAIHWGLGGPAVAIRGEWVPGKGCVPSRSQPAFFAAAIVYSTCVDFVVLVLGGWKLLPRRKRSQLMELLFKDGLIYFLVVFAMNVPLAVLALLNLNPVLDIIFIGPAAIISTTVASRAFRRLNNFALTAPAVFVTDTIPNPLKDGRSTTNPGVGMKAIQPSTLVPIRQIHIQVAVL